MGKTWSWSVGEYGATVRLFERRPGGILQLGWRDEGRPRTRSLGHRDKARARDEAIRLYQGRLAGAGNLEADLTVEQLFTVYEEERTPLKPERRRKSDRRRITLWTLYLAADKPVSRISKKEWESFQADRLAGVIDARGRRVLPDRREAVRARTVEADCVWLSHVLSWATTWRTGAGYLLTESPVRGLPIMREKNPRRPIMTQDLYEKLLDGAAAIGCLPEILEVANGTGRRLSSVLQLQYDDVRLAAGGPYGSVRWRAETDKTGRESVVPIGPAARAALERVLRARPGVGRAYLFPAPRDHSRPVSRHLAQKWGERAAKRAKVAWPGWHAIRRKWATERKHLPEADVARAGGWKNADTLRRVYQQPDPETLLRVVLEAGQLREVQG